MDNPIAPVDRGNLFPGSGRVKQAQETDKEKERKKFLEELEEELDDEQKKRKRDRVEIGTEHLNQDEQNESPSDEHEAPADEPAKRHIDLTA